MSIQYIQKTASALLNLIEDGEKLSLPMFSIKLAKACEIYPEDQTIGVMAGIVEKMADKKLTITRKEVKDLYNRLYSRNTKFASIFKEELGIVGEEKETVKKSSSYNDYVSMDSFAEKSDPVLMNGLNQAFGNKTAGYSKIQAERAVSVCSNVFAIQGLSPAVKVVSGNDEFIVCSASFETPKGLTSILVPVQFMDNKAIVPDVFIANAGADDLTRAALGNYITSRAGEKLNISGDLVLKTVLAAKNTEISDVDIAITKLNATRETAVKDLGGNITGLKMPAKVENVEVKAVQYGGTEFDSLAAQFDGPVGVAMFQFGKDKVNAGREAVANRLSAFGFGKSQISVISNTDKSVLYAVSMNNGRIAFRVPVKIEDGKIYNPDVIISNGSVDTFSVDTINGLCLGDKIDYKAAAIASSYISYKSGELVELVRKASVEGNYAQAEEALNILSEYDNKEAYAEAFEHYRNGLNGVKAEKSGCSMIVKSSTSNQPICGHLNLPLNKICTDKHGNCRPLYRLNMSETYDGAYLQNHKVLF